MKYLYAKKIIIISCILIYIKKYCIFSLQTIIKKLKNKSKQFRDSERRQSKRFAGYLWSESLKSVRVFSNIYEPKKTFSAKNQLDRKPFQTELKSQFVERIENLISIQTNLSTLVMMFD